MCGEIQIVSHTKSSYGWSALKLHHKIEKRKKEKPFFYTVQFFMVMGGHLGISRSICCPCLLRQGYCV